MSKPLSPREQALLERAVQLGQEGWGLVHPNPMVGCVLEKAGEVVGEGWHGVFGGPHAEVRALEEAGEGARGSTAFVSLEPCDHYGKTPPCSAALVEAGVSRVVYGAPDPGAESGGGAQSLRRAGLEVLGPVFSPEKARRENPAFYFNHEHGNAYVALKLAQTLDGKISEAPGRRTAITGAAAGVETHRLRAGFDAVMVGSGTALADDPFLTVREEVPCRKPPARIILDSMARTPLSANLFQDLPEAPLLVFTGPRAPRESVRGMERAGAHVCPAPDDGNGLSLSAVLKECWNRGIRSIFCEGGGRVAASLLAGGHVNRLFLFVAPFVLGEGGVPGFRTKSSEPAEDSWVPAVRPTVFGRDVLLTFDRV